LVASQLRKHLEDEVGGLVGTEPAGHWLVERVFRPGNRMDWSTHIESATNEPLNPNYFVDSLTD
jgi:Zn-dependent M32 family carboxypeptidase